MVPCKPGIVKSALAIVVGDPPVNSTPVYVPAVYPDPDEVIVPATD